MQVVWSKDKVTAQLAVLLNSVLDEASDQHHVLVVLSLGRGALLSMG
jgi:hypothetical protein